MDREEHPEPELDAVILVDVGREARRSQHHEGHRVAGNLHDIRSGLLSLLYGSRSCTTRAM